MGTFPHVHAQEYCAFEVGMLTPELEKKWVYAAILNGVKKRDMIHVTQTGGYTE